MIEVIPESEPLVLINIDVQGWEYHVLKGASKLLSRKGREAPYLIYEEDERLLHASNSSAKEIRDFLQCWLVIAPSMVQVHTAPRVVDIVSYLKVCHEKWSPATVLAIKNKK